MTLTVNLSKVSDLQLLPSEFRYVPIRDGEKRPIGKGWQDKPMTLDEVAALYQSKYQGVLVGAIGLMCGVVSGGLLLLDHDGKSGDALIESLSGMAIADALPRTIGWHSGREGHYQLAYRIPSIYWNGIQATRILTGFKSEKPDGKLEDEQVDFRWNGGQSLICGNHPSTEGYRWLEGMSPTDGVEVAIAPMWMIEAMLREKDEPTAPTSKNGNGNGKGFGNGYQAKSDRERALDYLDFLNPSDFDWHEWSGIMMAMHSAGCSEADALSWSRQSDKHSDRGFNDVWRHIKGKANGKTIGTLGMLAKERGWKGKEVKQLPYPKQSASVDATGDSLSAGSTPVKMGVSETVAAVDKILENKKEEWLELDELFKLQERSQLSKQAFWEMVKQVKCRRDLKEEVESRSRSLDKPKLDWSKAPRSLDGFVSQLMKDASKRSIDPTAVLAYVLPTIGGLVNREMTANFKGAEFPSILWSVLLMDSGDGKSRAEGLAMKPVQAIQAEASKHFKQEQKSYDDYMKASKKGDDQSDVEPPQKEKVLFEIATIQAVLERMAKSPTNRGFIWLRDEIAGLFKSLGQFSKGDNEAIEILLKLWDCATQMISDRVTDEKCFEIDNPRMALAGGLQPAKFSEVFKKQDDNDGLAGRMLFWYPQVFIERHKQGDVYLPVMLRKAYDNARSFSFNSCNASDAAYELWDTTVYQARLEAEKLKSSNPALSVWMKKSFGHLGRIAHCVHLLECSFNPEKNTAEITIETMEFALAIYNYCRESYEFMLNQGMESTDVQAILTKIMDKARAMDGLSAREACQYIRAIGNAAKEMKRSPNAYALDLFSQLCEMGKGSFKAVGKTKKFIPSFQEVSTVATVGQTFDIADVEPADKDGSVASTLDDSVLKEGDRALATLPADASEVELEEALGLEEILDKEVVIRSIELIAGCYLLDISLPEQPDRLYTVPIRFLVEKIAT
jgi:Protein of unknown function (DUF3987)/Bifunctional DNA primase/polymerase, N-terminal/Primase C terminal 2 (PriCT-2)